MNINEKLRKGHWTFVKSYNGRGPQGWTHEWRYAGEMNGKIWHGGFQKVEKTFDEMFIAQTFFYENSTVFDYPKRGSHSPAYRGLKYIQFISTNYLS